MSKRKDTDFIPTRRPITGLVADLVAVGMYNKLVAGWSLTNATKIGVALSSMLKAEKKRRKKLETK